MPGLMDQMRDDSLGRALLKIPGAIGRVRSGEVFATFVTPNAYAGYLALLLPLVAGVALAARGSKRKPAAIAAGILAGVSLAKRISGGLFRKLVLWLLLGIGVWLIIG